jgi:hypothetical protein
VETGLFTTVIDTAQPWPIKLPIDRLLKRRPPH